MSAAPAESPGWSRQRWLTIAGLVVAGQLAFIFWLAGHGSPPPPKVAVSLPRVYLPTESNADLLGVEDQTIFVRPNQHGFSGPAWMQTPALPYEQPKWTDSSPPSNGLRVQQLGATLNQFLKTNLADSVQLSPKPEPELPIVAPDDPLANAQSELIIEGDLANRSLRRPLKLQAWPATDTAEILSNSVVQAGVDQEGNVFSAVLAAPSGSKDADASALALAHAARFEPLRQYGATKPDTQTWGRFIFHWQTVAAPVTNNPATNHP